MKSSNDSTGCQKGEVFWSDGVVLQPEITDLEGVHSDPLVIGFDWANLEFSSAMACFSAFELSDSLGLSS